jgi:hypothetical protein
MIPKYYLSYSNGTSGINPYKFRSVGSTSEHLRFIYESFPYFSKLIQEDPIIILNYPSTLGLLDGFTVIDTYLREATFAQALQLAVLENKNVILIGQPLSIAHQIYTYYKSSLLFPKEIGIALGGYYCPYSLEKFITDSIKEKNASCNFIYGFGVAEIEFGCLLGTRLNESSKILYQKASSHIIIEIDKKSSELILHNVLDGTNTNTEDLIEIHPTNNFTNPTYVITQSPGRLSEKVTNLLESWDNTDWERNTGYLEQKDGELLFQLRNNVKKNQNYEIEYYDFLKQTGLTWTEKPVWSF